MASNKGKIELPFRRSVFTLTFAIEILGIDVWHDCGEGWLDLGPYIQALKIQYILYPYQNFDLDILVWPHAAKIWCGFQCGWVRTWQFLERRWITFSISHSFPVRVSDLRAFTATVNVTNGFSALSSNAKGDQNSEVYLPTLSFGVRRYFAPVFQGEQSLISFIQELFWLPVLEHIPVSFLDGPFDVPHPVDDVRHQDMVILQVKEMILNPKSNDDDEVTITEVSKASKGAKEKQKAESKVKFEIKLSGESLLAGAGRVIPFETVGDRPQEIGEMIILISSTSLPASDDFPVFFVNIDNLFDVPAKHLLKFGITEIYTRWRCGEEEHVSQTLQVKSTKNVMNFKDHYPLPLQYETGSAILATFLNDAFLIELRGIRDITPNVQEATLFGYRVDDRDFDRSTPPCQNLPESDVLIAICKVNLETLSKGISGVVRGEFPLYPPRAEVVHVSRDLFCSNDINAIRSKTKPPIIVPGYVVLEAQMTLEVIIGLAGCIPPKLTRSYSRLYSMFEDNESAMAILEMITEINDELVREGEKNNVLTGWMIDTGEVVFLFVEGPRNKQMMAVWERTGDFYSRSKTVFSSSAAYSSRLYEDFLVAALPFVVLKMFVPLSVILACPPIYARPALPLPTKSAALKLGRLIANGLESAPCNGDMLTVAELRSLRLELCTPNRPVENPRVMNQIVPLGDRVASSLVCISSRSKINWTT